jgi:hypothetical protein
MALLLIDAEPKGSQELTPDWEDFLPKMRLADLRTGRAWVNDVEKSGCSAWLFIKKIGGDVGEFQRLIELNLRGIYPEWFRPVPVLARGQGAPENDIGAMGLGSPFQAIVSPPAGESDAVATHAPSRSAARAEQGEDVPDILELVNRIHADVIQAERTAAAFAPRRRGYQAVTKEERLVAGRRLTVILTGVGAVGIVAMFLFFQRRTGAQMVETDGQVFQR